MKWTSLTCSMALSVGLHVMAAAVVYCAVSPVGKLGFISKAVPTLEITLLGKGEESSRKPVEVFQAEVQARKPDPPLTTDAMGDSEAVPTTPDTSVALAEEVATTQIPEPEKPLHCQPEAGIDHSDRLEESVLAAGAGDTGRPEKLAASDEPARAVIGTSARYRVALKPNYPEEARRRGFEGIVLVSMIVGEDGLPQDISLRKSSGYAILDEAAMSVVKKWQFYPATSNGAPVASLAELPIEFRLDHSRR